MTSDTGPVERRRPSSDRPAVLDIGAGDEEAPANAIPNIIAQLVETETWRNAATVVMGALLIGLGFWSYHGVRDSIAQTHAVSLDALLGTVSQGILVWAGEHEGEAARVAQEPGVVALAGATAAAARNGDAEAVCRSPDAGLLGQEIRSSLANQNAIALRVLDRAGVAIAAGNPAACGQRMRSPAFRERLDLAFDGSAQVVRPHADPALAAIDGAGRLRPVAWFLAPIRNRGSTLAVLAIGIAADRELVDVFSAARPGKTTEAYAFAADGLMLTPSRFADTLAEAGVLSDVNTALVLQVRDPGGDLVGGHQPALEPAARPLTRAAALAIAARDKGADGDRRGMISQPYRSYLGSEVIGAWRWLPRYDIGVVAETSEQEAYATLRYLLVTIAIIGGFVVLSLAAALVSSLTLFRLQRQFGRLQRLGAYTLERQISEGGMANIYLARHALLKRPTAIKILKQHVATDEFVHRFEREVQLASQLLHPNTVEIYDFGRTRDGRPYYVMEYLDGVTIAELVEYSGAAPPGRVIHVLRQVAAALREAHLRGMVHRDVKPENVMVCRRGEDDVVKLLDFGLVKNLEQADTRDVTKQIKILGTPRYMAPERILNPADADPRSDIYALGAVGYFMLTGAPIFAGDNSLEISNQVLHAPAPRPSATVAGLPEPLDSLIAACLEKDRAARPQNAQAVIEALDRLSTRLAWTQPDAAAWWARFRESRKSPKPNDGVVPA